MDEIKVPFLDYETIRRHANRFLAEYNQSGEIPVDIEHIIEIDLGMDLIPILGLMEAFNTDGFISRDFKSISIDLGKYEKVETRARFTLAHEIGHMVLHRGIWETFDFSNTAEWKEVVTSIDSKKYQFLEYHADNFAGLVLVPSPLLNEMFEEAKRKVLDQGFVLNDESEVVYGFIHRSIAQRFKVSEDVVRIRCKFEDLK